MTHQRLTVLAGLALVLLCLGTGWRVLHNDFTQDDVPLARDDARIQDLGNLGEIVTTPFWPKAGPTGHHRPAMTLTLALEWAAGDGRTLPFRIISLTLAAAATLAVFALALELLPVGWAVAAGAAFAVHPVHVEAIAVAINQGELVIALAYALLLRWYLRYRRTRDTTWRDRGLMAATMAVALFYKETGIVLPALLVAAELCFPHGRPWRSRWADLRPTILVQALVVAVVLAIRTAVLGGEVRGTFTAEALEGLSMGERALTMLAVVPEWLRLLFFPASLQADYAPREIMPATTFGLPQALGLAILVLALLLLVRTARSAPAITFGGLWLAIGLAPVHNVLVPAGIVLAERTLYLSSIGAMLLLGGICAEATAMRAGAARRVATPLVGAVVALLIVLGASRSHSRFGVWRDQRTLWTQTVIDAPDSYRAMLALGSLLTHPAYQEMAVRFISRGLDEWKNPAAMFGLSQLLQAKGDCEHAIPIAREALSIKELAPGRSEYLACLMWEGRYEEARTEALQGMRSGYWTPVFLRWVKWIDSVRVTSPPPRTVVSPGDLKALFTTDEEEPGVYQMQPPLPPPGPPWIGR